MKTKFILLLLAFVCVARAADDVARFFDAALARRTPYFVAGVSNKEVRAYEIVNRTAEIVAVRLTYPAKNGGDFVATKKFKLGSDQHLAALDVNDTSDVVFSNLQWIGQAAKQAMAAAPKTMPTMSSLIAEKRISLSALPSVLGEDYSKTKIEVVGADTVKLSVVDATGEVWDTYAMDRR